LPIVRVSRLPAPYVIPLCRIYSQQPLSYNTTISVRTAILACYSKLNTAYVTSICLDSLSITSSAEYQPRRASQTSGTVIKPLFIAKERRASSSSQNRQANIQHNRHLSDRSTDTANFPQQIRSSPKPSLARSHHADPSPAFTHPPAAARHPPKPRPTQPIHL
jgi:hypothetical protein